jgi:hypothetical protein
MKLYENHTICNIIQLLHLNEINMRLYGAEYNNIEHGEQSTTILNEAKPSSILLYSAPLNLILIKFITLKKPDLLFYFYVYWRYVSIFTYIVYWCYATKFRSVSTTRHGIVEGCRALDALGRSLLPLVPYPKRPRAFFVSFLKHLY